MEGKGETVRRLLDGTSCRKTWENLWKWDWVRVAWRTTTTSSPSLHRPSMLPLLARFLPCLSPPPSVKWNTRNVLESTFSFFFPTLALTWIPFLLVSRREEGRKKVSRKELAFSNRRWRNWAIEQVFGIVRRIFVQELCERLIRHAVHVALIYQTLGKERIIREVVNVAFQSAPVLCRASTFFPLSTRPRPCFNECKFLLFSSSSLSSFPLTIRTLSRDLRISIYVDILQKIKFPSKPDRRIFHAAVIHDRFLE